MGSIRLRESHVQCPTKWPGQHIEAGPPNNSSSVSRLALCRDAKAALTWLEKAVGFEPLAIMPGEGDDIAHAELRLGTSTY